MKYKDRNITIEADKILFFDIDRPFPALIDFFNPKKNQLVAGGRGLLHRCWAILGNLSEEATITVCDTTLHCAIPSIMYLRKNFKDKFITVSNNLVINEEDIARELIKNNLPHFMESSREAVDVAFTRDTFQYFIFNADDMASTKTAIEKLEGKRGVISIHNPGYKDTTWFLKYIIDRGLMGLENIDGSADLILL